MYQANGLERAREPSGRRDPKHRPKGRRGHRRQSPIFRAAARETLHGHRGLVRPKVGAERADRTGDF